MPRTGRGYGARVLDLAAAYRRTGADLPGGDPRPTHGAEMEGWFWRLTDVASGRVVVVLCGVNQHPDGPWAIVAIALHPGRIVRSGAFPGPRAATDRFEVEVPGVLRADERSLEVGIEGIHLTAALDDLTRWPLRRGPRLGSPLPRRRHHQLRGPRHPPRLASGVDVAAPVPRIRSQRPGLPAVVLSVD